jgi:hypothetical protein
MPAGAGPEDVRPIYARALRLRHLNPSATLCFIFLEGAIALGVVLALAELVDPWGVILLPLSVAAMVKINDLVAGAVVRSASKSAEGLRQTRPSVAARRAAALKRPVVGRASVPVQLVDPGRVYRSDKATWNGPTPQPTARAWNGPTLQPTARAWTEFGDVADTPEQRARQAATRRYE